MLIMLLRVMTPFDEAFQAFIIEGAWGSL